MLKEIAYKIRHLPGLSNLEWFWNLLRKPYHQFLNLNNKGVIVLYPEANFQIAIPPEFYSIKLAEYEKIATLKLINWLKKNPDSFILDIGCAQGLISTIALFASPDCQVIAVDSDLDSLFVTKKMIQYANKSHSRLSIVNCLIADYNTNQNDLTEVLKYTNELVNKSNLSGLPNSTKYINLDKNIDKKIPVYAIDHLFKNFEMKHSKVLIKCDVEGAELFVLKGAINFINKYNPIILLSVHPEILISFNYQLDEITGFLKSINYKHTLLAIDHEEHWWCVPKGITE
ncbi:MAG: FkbM family methyltransferase [Pelobium sp.]